jgi:hypothetical protein
MRISNPITVKELRSRMRGIRAILPMMAYLIVLGIFVLVQFGDYGSQIDYSILANRGRELGFNMLYAQLILVLLLSPAYSASAITVEKERETFETMQTTLLTAWDIVSGKVFSGVSYAVLLVLSSLPLLSLAFWMGGFDFIHLIWGFLIIASASLVVSCAGIMLSTIFARSYLATGVTYGVVIGGTAFYYLFHLILAGIYSVQPTVSSYLSWYTIPYWFSFTLNPFTMLKSLDFGDTGFYNQGLSTAIANPMIDGFSTLLTTWHIPYSALYIAITLFISWLMLFIASYFLFKSSREGPK